MYFIISFLSILERIRQMSRNFFRVYLNCIDKSTREENSHNNKQFFSLLNPLEKFLEATLKYPLSLSKKGNKDPRRGGERETQLHPSILTKFRRRRVPSRGGDPLFHVFCIRDRKCVYAHGTLVCVRARVCVEQP